MKSEFTDLEKNFSKRYINFFWPNSKRYLFMALCIETRWTFFFLLSIFFFLFTIMATVNLEPLFHCCRRETSIYRFKSKAFRPCSSLTCSSNKFFVSDSRRFCNFKPLFRSPSSSIVAAAASASSTDTTAIDSFQSTDVFFSETFPINRTEKVCIGMSFFLFSIFPCLVRRK